MSNDGKQMDWLDAYNKGKAIANKLLVEHYAPRDSSPEDPTLKEAFQLGFNKAIQEHLDGTKKERSIR